MEESAPTTLDNAVPLGCARPQHERNERDGSTLSTKEKQRHVGAKLVVMGLVVAQDNHTGTSPACNDDP